MLVDVRVCEALLYKHHKHSVCYLCFYLSYGVKSSFQRAAPAGAFSRLRHQRRSTAATPPPMEYIYM